MADAATGLTITHHVAGTGGRYVATLADSAEQGYLEWEAGGMREGREIRVAAHTIVPRAIGGRGVAAALVQRLVEDAQRCGFVIRPDCSYVARKFTENPDWAALRA
ncbi:MAG: GNAT family N-acetyltransferase [Erythrobacter sp.]|jgi:predicted GNAT family acetyltransferase